MRSVISLILTTTSILHVFSISPGCDPGRFGANCQYDCRCQSSCTVCRGDRLCGGTCDALGGCSAVCGADNCDSDGQCINGAKCRSGSFGPACQYVDLMQYASITPGNIGGTLSDGDDASCLINPGVQSITVTWTQQYPFTWLRAHVGNADLLHNITVQFRNGTSTATVDCPRRQSAVVSDTILDIHCDLGVTMSQLILTGEAVASLCSLYISGGRNVGLRQRANQTSTFSIWSADRAVDGDTNGFYAENSYLSCSHTDVGKRSASWTLTLTHPHHIGRYVLYNRQDCCADRLKGFTLTSFDSGANQVFSYTDTSFNSLVIYHVYSTRPVPSVSTVEVLQTNSYESSTRDVFLSLCEVEIYADSACAVGRYGRECEYNCNCAVASETCFVSTGGCPSGCAAGFQGENCQSACPPTKYGIDCRYLCSNNCSNGTCRSVNGQCFACVAGKRGDFCETDCPQGSYGHDCGSSCSERCAGGGLCDAVSGACFDGCQIGYALPNCDAECPVRKYGMGCNLTCSDKCLVNETAAPAVCHHVTGQCLLGCVNDTSGTECPTTDVGGNAGSGGGGDDGEDNTGLIAGVVVAVLVVLVVAVIVGVILFRKRRRKPSRTDEIPIQTSTGDGVDATNSQDRKITGTNNNTTSAKEDTGTPALTSSIASPKSGEYYNQVGNRFAIPVKDLGAFLASHDIDYFKDQFEKIPGVIDKYTMEVGLSDENKHKNRYKNICTYDHSRVHLKVNRQKHEGDYINASYVEGYGGEQFIASQGPNQLIIDDFIRMLWEQKPEVVVMLTKLIEEGKSRCDQYWPDDTDIMFGEITVQLQTTHVFADYTIRKLRLIKKKSPPHDLIQFHFTSWPDKGVPDTPWPLVDFQQRVASLATTRPIVVHCSAGVGRSGTFIALRDVLREAESTGTMDFYSSLLKLRNARVHMIQTLEQYLFLHKAAQVAIVCHGTTVTANGIADRIDQLNSVSETGRTRMEEEYEAVCNVCTEEKTFSSTNQSTQNGADSLYQNISKATYKDKNRVSNVLPNDSYRPFLTGDLKNQGDYINAVMVPGFKRRDNQILTQLPMPTTLLDFWRLVTQYKVSLIVAFEPDEKDKDATIGDYLPLKDDETITCGPFDIRSGTTVTSSFWDEQKLTVSTNDLYSSISVTGSTDRKEYLISHLKCARVDSNIENLLSLVEKIRSLKSSTERRTLYMCRNGALHSGLACVLTLLLDRLDNDHRLTVPLVVGLIKYIRPQVIPTLEQYKVLYEVLKWYKETSAVYSNFPEPSLDTQSKPSPDAEPVGHDKDNSAYANDLKE